MHMEKEMKEMDETEGYEGDGDAYGEGDGDD